MTTNDIYAQVDELWIAARTRREPGQDGVAFTASVVAWELQEGRLYPVVVQRGSRTTVTSKYEIRAIGTSFDDLMLTMTHKANVARMEKS